MSKQSRARSENSFKNPLIRFYSVFLCPFKMTLGINKLYMYMYFGYVRMLDNNI